MFMMAGEREGRMEGGVGVLRVYKGKGGGGGVSHATGDTLHVQSWYPQTVFKE